MKRTRPPKPDPTSEHSQAKADALRLLRFRPRSVKEMAQRLKQRGHRGFIIAQVIKELEEKKFLDDKTFARLWVGDRITLKPSGRNLLVKELKSKGVSEKIIDEVLDEFKDTYNEHELAKALALKRIERLKGIEEDKAVKRLFDFLSRRGFSYNTIWRIIKEIYNYDYTD